MRDLLPALGVAAFVWAFTFLATVDWIHPHPRTAPERTRP